MRHATVVRIHVILFIIKWLQCFNDEYPQNGFQSSNKELIDTFRQKRNKMYKSK